MEKRGFITLRTIIDLVIGISVFLMLLMAAKTWGTGEIFQKAYVARDNAILFSTFYASNGNGYVLYPADVSKFLLDYKGDTIKVFKFEDDPLAAEYSFIREGDSSFDLELENPKSLVLVKSGGEFEINIDTIPNINKVKCDNLDTKGDLNKKILIDAGHGDGTGINVNGLDEGSITSAIAQAFYIKAGSTRASLSYSRKGNVGDNSIRLLDHEVIDLSDKSDIIISIHTGDYDHKKNVLKVHYADNDYSKKLACLILNNVLDHDLDIEGANIILNLDLRPSKIDVLIEAGNTQITGDNMLGDISAKNSIGTAIFEGLKAYYG